jgi:hypothetical protein
MRGFFPFNFAQGQNDKLKTSKGSSKIGIIAERNDMLTYPFKVETFSAGYVVAACDGRGCSTMEGADERNGGSAIVARHASAMKS